jgi:hypothetical protein
MERFNLEEWLKDKSRKVVTERNKEVRIICTDINCAYPIIAAIKINDDRETPLSYDINGKCPFYEGNDLFFADEDNEFETTMISFSHAMFDHLLNTNVKVDIKEWKNKLLDLARKEIEKSNPYNEKQEWSEEDREMLDNCLGLIQEIDSTQEEQNWLRSLKYQNRWKPSKEQMEVFEHFVKGIGESGYASPYDNNTKLIHSLLNDLKKL